MLADKMLSFRYTSAAALSAVSSTAISEGSPLMMLNVPSAVTVPSGAVYSQSPLE